MANYATLKAAINAVIKANGNKEITGTVLNETLTAMVNSLGANYQFAGVATPSTNPGTPDQNVFYLAGQAGTYTNFNNIALPDGVSVLKWNGSWSSETVLAGDGVFDISAYKATGGTLATFADLSAALDGGNNIPSALRKGGMSVKFIQGSAQSSDNKYVQFRLMSDSFNTTIANWQGVDDVPTVGSTNIPNSGGTAKLLYNNLSGFYTVDYDYKECIKAISFECSNAIAEQHELYIYMFGVFDENNKFYFGIFDKTENKRVGYAYTSDIFDPIPDTGIQTFTFATLLGNASSWQAQNVTISIDWSKYSSSLYFLSESSTLIRLFPNIYNVEKNVVNTMENMQRSNGLIYGFSTTKKKYEDFILDLSFNAPQSVLKHNIVVNIFGIHPDNNKFYIGFFDKTENKRVGYIASDQVFSTIPSNCQTFRFETLKGNESSYTITGVQITVDWSQYTSDMYVESQNTPIIAVIRPVCMKSVVSASANIGELIAAGIYDINSDCILDSTVTIPDNVTVNLNGHTVRTASDDSTSKIVVGNNSSLINGVFVGNQTLSTSRTLEETGHYCYEKIIQDYSQGKNYAITYHFDTKHCVEVAGNNASVRNCIFKDYGGAAVAMVNEADRVATDNVYITGCAFEFCYCGIYNVGEFNRVENCLFHGNLIGFYSPAGNFLLTGCHIKMNDIGVTIYNNGNGGHSEIVSCKFAHCQRAIQVPNGLLRVLGLVITGGEFADAPIQGYSASSILLSGCRLDAWFDSGGGDSCAAVGNIIRNAYALRDNKPIFSDWDNLKANTAMVDGIDNQINN